ncbi:hypothetical protein EYF80_050085 [Liparis tanakae]|uniref:Uncharacterized protein n=1 Tax=Liparis tanakae TaxID=230148 RepID=A0A4Z2FG73_9TELE|nr:hypothetical protein EYF80_050085 [Liparis tanakae]
MFQLNRENYDVIPRFPEIKGSGSRSEASVILSPRRGAGRGEARRGETGRGGARRGRARRGGARRGATFRQHAV